MAVFLPYDMSEAHFSLIFRGPAVDNGEIDVQDFAPALLAVGDLLQAANEVINGDQAKVAVKVRSTTTACFEVDLSLWQQIVESYWLARSLTHVGDSKIT
jgi:hypothetical protein